MQASLLAKLRDELGGRGTPSASPRRRSAWPRSSARSRRPRSTPPRTAARRETAGPGARAPATGHAPAAAPGAGAAEHRELTSLYQPGHMRRRLDQLVETNRRYGHPFGLAVFDASGPGTRNGDAGGGQETVLAIVGAALRDSIRIVDEAFRLEEDAICVLAPNLRTVEGVQMAERLLGQLDELERAGACGSRSRPGSSPAPSTAPTPSCCCTRPTRRCGGRVPSGSRWASALCKIADRFPKSVHN